MTTKKLSKKFLKEFQEGDNFPIERIKNLLKIKETEGRIDELNEILEYLITQIHDPESNIIKTIVHKIDILQAKLDYHYIKNNNPTI